MSKLIVILNLWRIMPVWFFSRSNKVRELIDKELAYWGKCLKMENMKSFMMFSIILCTHKEYRNLLENRFRILGNGRRIIFRVLFPLMDTLNICCDDIGECLFIQHGFATQISAKKIGKYCWINQQVTVGWSFDDEPPTIGNGVRISAGAKVIGKISIGDNAIIAANAAAVKDVDSESIVGGVPARVIGFNSDHKLYIDL
jgi:serine O-acetyltransferase